MCLVLLAAVALPAPPLRLSASLMDMAAQSGYHLASDEHEVLSYAERLVLHEEYIFKLADATYAAVRAIDGRVVASQFGLDGTAAHTALDASA